jgi:sigma-B regulation protein RsbU (phosphoserine phosphatase)
MSDMSEKPPTILIIDDVPLNVALLEVILLSAGYRILKAFSGMEGRHLALKDKPALILLDVMMPQEDGVMTCRILKADPRTADIPVIFITALDGVADRVSGFGNGAVDYITKPFERTEVLAKTALHIHIST